MYQKVDLNYKSDSSLFCRKTPSFGKPARIAKAKGKGIYLIFSNCFFKKSYCSGLFVIGIISVFDPISITRLSCG